MDKNLILSDLSSVSEEEYYATINLRQNEQTFKERQNGEIKFSFTALDCANCEILVPLWNVLSN